MFSVTLLIFSDDTHYIPDILVHLLISLSCRFSILFLPVCYKNAAIQQLPCEIMGK